MPSARAKSGPIGITMTKSRMLTNCTAATSSTTARSRCSRVRVTSALMPASWPRCNARDHARSERGGFRSGRQAGDCSEPGADAAADGAGEAKRVFQVSFERVAREQPGDEAVACAGGVDDAHLRRRHLDEFRSSPRHRAALAERDASELHAAEQLEGARRIAHAEAGLELVLGELDDVAVGQHVLAERSQLSRVAPEMQARGRIEG